MKGRYIVATRPGIGLAYQQRFGNVNVDNVTTLPGPCVFIDRVIVGPQSPHFFTDNFNSGADGEYLHQPWTPAPWKEPPDAPKYNGRGQVYATDGENRVVVLNHLDYDPTIPYTFRMTCLKDHHFQRGTYRLYFQLANTDPDPNLNGVVISVTMEDQNGDWTVQVDHRRDGILVYTDTQTGSTSTSEDEDFTIVATITQHSSVYLTLKLDFASATDDTVYDLEDIGAKGIAEGEGVGFGIQSSTLHDNEDYKALVDAYIAETYTAVSGQTAGRSFFVTSAKGIFWALLGNDEFTWSIVPSNQPISQDKMIQTAQRYGTLYMADYSAVKSAGTGTGRVEDTNLFRATTVNNWGALGIDKRTDKIVLTNSSTPSANGTFKIEELIYPGAENATLRELIDGVATISMNNVENYPVGTTVTVALSPANAVFDGSRVITAKSEINGSIDFNVTGTNVTFKQIAANVATLTTGATHPFIVGQVVFIDLNPADATFDGAQTITAVTGTSISYAKVAANTGPTATTGFIDITIASTGGTVSQTANYLKLSPNPGNTAATSFRIQKAPLRYVGDTNEVSFYTADPNKGSVPLGCPLIANWDGRIVMGGGYIPHAAFASEQGNPYGWNYAANGPTAAIAFTPPPGSRNVAGEMDNTLTQIIPMPNNYLLFGCNNALWVSRGNPALIGNPVQWISETVGMNPGKSWARDEGGGIYFYGTSGLYYLTPDCNTLVNLSSEKLLYEMSYPDEERFIMKTLMAYDKRYDCVYVWNSRTTGGGSAAGNWIYHVPTKSFWKNQWTIIGNVEYFPGTLPYCINQFDDYFTQQSAVIHGCADGYLRVFRDAFTRDDDNNTTDDYNGGYTIFGNVLYGPFSWDAWREVMLNEVQVKMAVGSREVKFQVYAGETAEQAYDTFKAGNASFYTTSTGYNFSWTTQPTRVSQVYQYPKVRARWQYINLIAPLIVQTPNPGFAGAEEILLGFEEAAIWRPN